ncbi:MAG: hypothetical protein AB7K68_11020 [Bacteriovoracia bacterium]
MKEFIQSLSGAVPLKRKGARLSSPLGSWQMLGVYGPLSLEERSAGNRQFFRIETSSRETLLVYRDPGERGMRELYLYEVAGAESQPAQSRAG